MWVAVENTKEGHMCIAGLNFTATLTRTPYLHFNIPNSPIHLLDFFCLELQEHLYVKPTRPI